MVALAAVVTLSACGSSTAAKVPPCSPVHDAQYPTTDGTLSDADTGGTWCLATGQTLVVQLHVPTEQADARWSAVAPSSSAVLEPISNGAFTLPRGITATFLAARRSGVVTLLSSRPDGSAWLATVVVSGKAG